MATTTRKPTRRMATPPAEQPKEAGAPIDVRTPRERIDVILRFCQDDDPFVVDWAPPQS